MEKTLTVKELIEQLSKVDQNLPVYVSGVGLTVNDSWDAPLQFDNDTVDVYKGKCRIHMSTVGWGPLIFVFSIIIYNLEKNKMI